MDGEEYDLVIMGTGVTESILSGLFSMEGRKVLHVDSNPFYGGSGASLNLTALWKKFKPEEKVPEELGQNRDWNIDLIPKFVMAYGKLVKMIIKTEVSHYLSWKCVEGTYVYQYKKGGIFSKEGGTIQKVPANDKEALSSDLMSLFEKRRCHKFYKFLDKFDEKVPATHPKKDPFKSSFADFIEEFGLEDSTIDFLGHAVALYTTEEFMKRPAVEVIRKMQLYKDSVGRFGDSPFIYPVYGLAGIPESFARKCAVYGGTFMLNVDITDIEVDKESGRSKVWGIYEGKKSYATTKHIITSPEYLIKCGMADRLQKIGTIVRVICIIDHPIPKTGNSNAVQIILPQKQTKRKNDIYIMCIGNSHGVCKKGYYVAIISSMQENPDVDTDLAVAFETIGPIKYRFTTKEDQYVPKGSNGQDAIYVTQTLDPTSHFETAAENVLEIYKAITGKDVDLTIKEAEE